MFKVLKEDASSRARLGVLETKHGIVETPACVIVGTHGAVRCLEPEDLPGTKTQLIIANTYHLWRELGDEGLQGFTGLHATMGWQGPLMTDSGGFQVFSLGFLRDIGARRGGTGKEVPKEKESESWVRITPAGVYFKPGGEEGEEESYLDSELSIRIQEQLGADIIVAFDEPTAPLHNRDYTAKAMERTHEWAKRSLEARESKQLLYGVVQGGAFEELRKESARVIGAMPFDGFAIGGTYGDAYGGTKADTWKMLEWSVPILPSGKPRHLFGVGQIDDIFEAVERGIDTFDCVIPTREARHGRLWTQSGHFDITKGAYASDEGKIDETCSCPVCAGEEIRKKDLHELFKSKNFDAGRFATIHNVFFFNSLLGQISEAIKNDAFPELKKKILGKF